MQRKCQTKTLIALASKYVKHKISVYLIDAEFAIQLGLSLIISQCNLKSSWQTEVACCFNFAVQSHELKDVSKSCLLRIALMLNFSTCRKICIFVQKKNSVSAVVTTRFF